MLDIAKVADVMVLITHPNQAADELADDEFAQQSMTILKVYLLGLLFVCLFVSLFVTHCIMYVG